MANGYGRFDMASFKAEKKSGATAIFFNDADCVEYLKADVFAVYERVDEFLTVIRALNGEVIGFKLKGFRYVFNAHLVPLYRLQEGHFLKLRTIIEVVCSAIGDQIFADARREEAYKSALEMAANDDLEVNKLEYALAA